MTTLTLGAATIDLPDDMLWSDEFDWSPVQTSLAYSAQGALLLDSGVRLAGRPITLDGSHAWVPRSTVLALYAWLVLPQPALVLVYRGATYQVTWAVDGTPLAAAPIVDFADPDSADSYSLTLRFITRA